MAKGILKHCLSHCKRCLFLLLTERTLAFERVESILVLHRNRCWSPFLTFPSLRFHMNSITCPNCIPIWSNLYTDRKWFTHVYPYVYPCSPFRLTLQWATTKSWSFWRHLGIDAAKTWVNACPCHAVPSSIIIHHYPSLSIMIHRFHGHHSQDVAPRLKNDDARVCSKTLSSLGRLSFTAGLQTRAVFACFGSSAACYWLIGLQQIWK